MTMVEDEIAPEMAPRRARKDVGLPALGVLGGDASWSVMALLVAAGVSVAETEPAPKQINADLAARFQFGYASVRCGALGDLRQVLQLIRAATGTPSPAHAVWTAADGSFIDGFRPLIDPFGFAGKADLASYRAAHLAQVLKLVQGVSTLVLPLEKTSGLRDADGTAYPAPPVGAKLPRGCKLAPTVYDTETMLADFAALHAALKAMNPGLRVRLVVAAPADGLAALTDRAQLRAVAAHAAASFADVIHDPVLDHLLSLMAVPGADARLGGLVQKLIAGENLLDAVAIPAAPQLEDADLGIPAPTPAAAPREKRDRAQRKAERAAKGKSKGGKSEEAEAKGAKVMCEDELLEAFS